VPKLGQRLRAMDPPSRIGANIDPGGEEVNAGRTGGRNGMVENEHGVVAVHASELLDQMMQGPGTTTWKTSWAEPSG
jgi:hypothetical protein